MYFSDSSQSGTRQGALRFQVSGGRALGAHQVWVVMQAHCIRHQVCSPSTAFSVGSSHPTDFRVLLKP